MKTQDTGVLVADEVETVTWDARLNSLEVYCSGACTFTTDGTDPVDGAEEAYSIPAVGGARTVSGGYNATGGRTVVKLVAAADSSYIITMLD